MSASDRIEQYLKLATAIFGVAVGIAQFLLLSAKADKPTHFAVYLIGQTWVEASILLALWGVFLVARFVYGKIKDSLPDSNIRAFSITPGDGWLLLPVVLAIGLAGIAFDGLYHLAKARRVFWLQTSKKAYVETYKSRIQAMAESGRIKDANDLVRLLIESLGDSSDSESLHSVKDDLEMKVQLSTHLTESGACGSVEPSHRAR